MNEMPRRLLPLVLAGLIMAVVRPAFAEDAPAPKTVGWRGNWTGLFPDADPPTQWARMAKGVAAGLTCQAARPADGAPKSGQPLDQGLVRDWLAVGPMPVADSVKDFDKEQIPGETDLKPAEGDKVADLAWTRLQLPKTPDYERWGTTELDWLDLGEAMDCKPNQVAYACTYLYAERAGKTAMVVDHAHGLKVWVNGKAVYSQPQRNMGLGSYVGISRQKQELYYGRSPKFEFPLSQGWNRLLAKVGTWNQKGSRELKFAARLLDADAVPYDEKNILWMTELPERTNASPIIVGDRIFTPAEPDELVCLDKKTGKILWRRFNGLYEATPEADRAAKPVFKEKIAPLVEALEKTTQYEEAVKLRRQISDLLIAADPKYKLKWDGHLAGHFGIVGFTTTPTSDGRQVWAFFGQGVVACYDLEGNRRWIRRLDADEVRYSCSPALAGGKLVCIFGGMHGLDAATGATAWKVPDATSIASLIPARIKGTDCVFTQKGLVFRASDGKKLWANPRIIASDTGWGAPTVLGDMMYLSWYGISNLIIADFSKVEGEAWKPDMRIIELAVNSHRPDGKWLDRWTAGSPLVWGGAFYGIDQYGVFYAADLKTGKTLYKQDVGFDELHTYNHIGVGASATLGGKYIYVIDNQGMCVVLEPGPAFKPVAVNRIETALPRDWPMPPQEILANGPPVFEGKRMYLRGEKYLYCIGEKP